MTRIRMFAAALAAILIPSLAHAQASAPRSRADVKAETRAAEKSGQLTPAGEGPMQPAPGKASTMTREQRKAATTEARKKGELFPAGPAGQTQAMDAADASKKSTKTPAERKAETAEARKKGELVPAGEGPAAPKK